MGRIYYGRCKKLTAFLVVGAILTGTLLPQTGGQQAFAQEIDTEEPAVQTDYGISNPRGAEGSDVYVRTWDCIYFGNYWQSDTNDDGIADRDDAKEPILWRVLSVDGDDAFLLAERDLEYQKYNEIEGTVTWETSTIRSWLNGYGASDNACGRDYTDDNFLDNAFSPAEQEAIRYTTVKNDDNVQKKDDNTNNTAEGGNDTIDRVYLLSLKEATEVKYGFIQTNATTFTRSVKETDYVWEKVKGEYRNLPGSYLSQSRYGEWWLRTPGVFHDDIVDGEEPYLSNRAVLLRGGDEEKGGHRLIVTGCINVDGTYCHHYESVRPVLHIDLSHTECWTYAGTVNSQSKENENLLPAPTPLPTEVLQPTPTSLPIPFPPTTDMPLSPSTDSNGVTTWDCVYFGNYWQNDTNGDGTANRKDSKEPIKWRVLSVDGDDALLLSDQGIAYQAYNEIWSDVTWETSTIRSWLNGYGPGENLYGKDYTHNTFLNYAFTDEEQLAIKDTELVNADNEKYNVEGGADTIDKVYLLSRDDVLNPEYGFPADAVEEAKERLIKVTDYAKSRGVVYGAWWLRTPGDSNKTAGEVDFGWVSYGYVDDWRIVVRPALHLNLAEQACWTYAGTVTSDGKVTTPVSTVTPSVTGNPAGTESPSATESPSVTETPSVTENPLPTVTSTVTPTATLNVTPTSTPTWLIPEVTYDAAEFETFAGRTKEEAAGKYVEARFAAQGYDEMDITSIYEEMPSLTLPYSAGTLSKDALVAMISLCNYYRWLVGSEDAEGDTDQETYGIPGWHEMQRQAFLCNFPSKPEDFPEDQWGRPSTSYYMFSQGATPLEAIKNAVNEKYTSWDDSVYYEYNQRKSILAPGSARIRMGFSGNWLSEQRIGKNNGENKKKEPFYSFPSEGYMPNDLLDVEKTAWSVRINLEELEIPSGKDVSISVIHRESGERYERSAAEGNAYAYYDTILFKEPAANDLSAYTGTYDVEVKGLLDVATGKGAKLCYTVTFFDASQELTSEVKEVSIDGIDRFVMTQQMAVSENIEKLTAILPKQVTVTGENGRSIILPVKGNWIYDEAGSCWRNSVDAATLPSGLTDHNGVLSDFSIGCEVGDNQGLTFEMSWTPELNETNPTDGRGGKITIKRNPTSEIDSVVLYQITKSAGIYTAALRYDTKSSWGVKEEEENHAFVIPTAYFLADTGDYVAVGYTENGKTAWLSDTIVPLLVTVRKAWNGNGTSTGGTGGSNNSTEGGNNTTGGTGTANSEEKKQQTDKKIVIPKVAKVKGYKVKAKKKGFILTWKKDSKVSGYQVQFSTKKNFKGAKTISISKSKTKYTTSKLKAGKKYYIRIRAYRIYQTQEGKKKKVYGKWTTKYCRTKR